LGARTFAQSKQASQSKYDSEVKPLHEFVLVEMISKFIPDNRARELLFHPCLGRRCQRLFTAHGKSDKAIHAEVRTGRYLTVRHFRAGPGGSLAKQIEHVSEIACTRHSRKAGDVLWEGGWVVNSVRVRPRGVVLAGARPRLGKG
jgi:hypothetical protein